jgi:hypothetical protein
VALSSVRPDSQGEGLPYVSIEEAGALQVMEAEGRMSKEELAARLNGREYGGEITNGEAADAKAAGLVVLFGASDDLAEFRGAVEDEEGCYGGGEILIVDGNIYQDPDCECEWAQAAKVAARKRGRTINAVWCGPSGYDWAYETDIPHATFSVIDGSEKYCRGVVFALADAQ